MDWRFGRLGTYLGDTSGRGPYRRYRERKDRRRRLPGQTLAPLNFFSGHGAVL
jgi:hypothetical protein